MEDSNRTTLKQDDFRKLLMTPRSVSRSDSSAGAGSSGGGSINSGGKPPSVKKKYFKPRPQVEKEKDASSEEDPSSAASSSYRDRAEERRKGEAGDYQETYSILSRMGGETEGGATSISYDQSKYLGGDMEHTHLVKGLDFALLRKVRSEMDTQEAKEDLEKQAEEEQEVSFLSEFAKRIFDSASQKPPKPEKNELFRPGRMMFRYELEDRYSSDIPTSIIRSKADILDSQNNAADNASQVIIDKVCQIMAHLHRGSAGASSSKKAKKKDKSAGGEYTAVGESSSSMAAEERRESLSMEESNARTHSETKVSTLPMALPSDAEDIFPDAGGYVFEEAIANSGDSSSSNAKTTVKKPERYFASSSDAMDIPTETSEPYLAALPKSGTEADDSVVQSAMSTILKIQQKSAEMEKQKRDIDKPVSATTKLEHLTASDDGITGSSEYDAYDNVAYDSDEEDSGVAKMDHGTNKRKQLSRYDFDTDEEFSAYKESQEAVPRAAFQFGVKLSDGRKTSKALSKEGKLNRDFSKINQIFTKKHGKGMEGDSSSDSGSGGPQEGKRRKILNTK